MQIFYLLKGNSIIAWKGKVMKIKYKLRELRINKNLTYRKLSNLTGMQERMIVRIEKSEVNVTLLTLLKLAKALEVKLEELFEIEEE